MLPRNANSAALSLVLLFWIGVWVAQSFANAMSVHQQQQQFAFVESYIDKVLRLEVEEDGEALPTRQYPRHEPLLLLLTQKGAEPSTCKDLCLSVSDLVPLARHCDQLVFGESSIFSERNHDDDDGNAVDAADGNCFRGEDILQELRQDALSRLVRKKQQQLELEGEEIQDKYGEDESTTTTIDASCWVLMSTLLALNALESSIRQATGHSTARAPLLTTMLHKLQQIQPQQQHHAEALIQVLRLVLLPTGLNFRNMLWHGFVGRELPRAWLALVIYLVHQVRYTWSRNVTHVDDKAGQQDNERTSAIAPTQDKSQLLPLALQHLSSVHPQLELVVQQGSQLRHSIIAAETSRRKESIRHPVANNILQWLPSEHASLWHFVCCHILTTSRGDKQCPWICIALLLLLLEHGIRLDWCRVNDNRQNDARAVSGQFYVTLDGHGQKHKHNLLLYPYVYDDASFVAASSEASQQVFSLSPSAHRNRLIPLIGAETTAMLTDLLMSPTEDGPNVRAALSHGLLDECLDQEILRLLTGQINDDTDVAPTTATTPVTNHEENHAWDIVDALLVALDRIATSGNRSVKTSLDSHNDTTPNALRQYRPVFSYTAITAQQLRTLDELLQRRLNETVLLHRDLIDKCCQSAIVVPKSILEFFSVRSDQLAIEMKIVSDLFCLESVDAEWTVERLYAEHATNQRLAPLGATRLLLSDLNRVVTSFLGELERSLSESAELNKRAQRRRARVIATVPVAHQFFSFAGHVCLIALRKGLDPTETSLDDFTSAEMLHAVKRTRMVLSTVETFLLVNAERAFKAIDEYQKGKPLQKILATIESCIGFY